jgi:ribokinase
VVGSANVDLTTFTDEFPRPGETILGKSFHLGWGGKGANQAVAARLCGADVAMVARVGGDLFGPATIENLSSHGIDVQNVRITEGTSTGVAPIFVDSAGENRILVVKGANDHVSPGDVESAADLLRSADCVILQLEIPLETVWYTLRLSRQFGVRTILNVAPAQQLDVSELRDAEWVIANETEAQAISGQPACDGKQARNCAEWLIRKELRNVVITLGANGAVAASANETWHSPAFRVTPVDTTGAGDAFTGSFAYFLSSGYEPKEAISRANLYAGLSTEKVGTQSSFLSGNAMDEEWARRTQRQSYRSMNV